MADYEYIMSNWGYLQAQIFSMLEIPGKEGLSTAASALLGQPVKAKSALVIVWITNHGASNVYKTRLKFEWLRYIQARPFLCIRGKTQAEKTQDVCKTQAKNG